MVEYVSWDKYIQSKCEHKNINGNSATCMDCGMFNYVWDNGRFAVEDNNRCDHCGIDMVRIKNGWFCWSCKEQGCNRAIVND